ncbi:MAG TPA: cytochrome c [Vicinamibacterales bacterium]|jgi:mono/diheme cytochrome c family protein
MTIRRFLKRTALTIVILAVVGFIAFLYFIPPLTMVSVESLVKPEAAAPPSLDDIKDPAERALAERGRYLVTVTGCTGCHTPQGSAGPDWDDYLAGGGKFIEDGSGSAISANLTPDPETGLGRLHDDEVLRVLRSGVFPDGHQAGARQMPWPAFSKWTPEDRHAVLVYLRHLRPVWHRIPNPDPHATVGDPQAIDADYGADYGVKKRDR